MLNVDRRVLYVIMMLVVVYAFVNPMGLPVSISANTRAAFNAVNALPPGSVLVMSMDYGASAIPELEPAAKAMFHQALTNNVRVMFMGMWVQAGDMTERILADVLPHFPNKVYGVDFVNVGYKPGSALLLERMVADIKGAALDICHRGQKLSEMPFFAEFTNLSQAAFWVCYGAGDPGSADWIKVVRDPLGVPGTVSLTSVSIPGNMIYVQSGQITGIIGGMRGAAEYELLSGRPGRAIAGMDAQSLTHVLILAFIALGNVAFLVTRKKAG